MSNSSSHTEFERSVTIGGDFGITITHRCNRFHTNHMHSHDYCELTVYTEGNKSVFVNDSIYISESGCAFTFRPGEMHCGLHNEQVYHERYVIAMKPDCFRAIENGDRLLRCFFDREAGKQNMVIMPEDVTRDSIQLLDTIVTTAGSALPERNAVMLADFIRYLTRLNQYYQVDSDLHRDHMPDILRHIIASIDQNLSHPLRIAELAAESGISIATLERLFRDTLETTPRQFIMTRRIEYAKRLLREGKTVTEACYEAGFGDYSHFIADFKRFVGVTPATYRRL